MVVGSRKVEGGAVNRLTTVARTTSMIEVMGHGRPEVRAGDLIRTECIFYTRPVKETVHNGSSGKIQRRVAEGRKSGHLHLTFVATPL